MTKLNDDDDLSHAEEIAERAIDAAIAEISSGLPANEETAAQSLGLILALMKKAAIYMTVHNAVHETDLDFGELAKIIWEDVYVKSSTN